ncbi:MAG: cytochrome c [Proteobacteria bacterium]|nr:cytochrome c [Pseudomonadota bacterium]
MEKLSQHLTFVLMVFTTTLIVAPAAFAQAQAYSGVTDSIALFQENCAVCHGDSLQGEPQGTPLRGELRHGDSMAEITASIGNGYVDAGMPSWRDNFSNAQIRNIALFILETRADVNYETSNFEMPSAGNGVHRFP